MLRSIWWLYSSQRTFPQTADNSEMPGFALPDILENQIFDSFSISSWWFVHAGCLPEILFCPPAVSWLLLLARCESSIPPSLQPHYHAQRIFYLRHQPTPPLRQIRHTDNRASASPIRPVDSDIEESMSGRFANPSEGKVVEA